MNEKKTGMFTTDDGKNVLFTFMLVSSLFLLWGFCNGMIDVMDKHFQDELKMSQSQSAWVQFAHYLGYFLMAMPAAWLTNKLGYKGGIIAGLLIVAAGGAWFIPASKMGGFVPYLAGVCVLAAGLTFLETIANPYTTVLGDKRQGAARINIAQSCNGVGWIFGPIAGGLFFYSKDASGKSTGSQTLWIPYAAVAVVVLALAVVFYFANVPDVKAPDDYKIDGKDDAEADSRDADREVNRPLVYVLLLLNSLVMTFACGMIFLKILEACNVGHYCHGIASAIPRPASMALDDDNSLLLLICAAGCIVFVIIAAMLVNVSRKITHHSIWSHPHFSSATLTQFFYVAAQAGIFSFLINYMTSQVPPISDGVVSGFHSFSDNWVVRHLGLHSMFSELFEKTPDGANKFSNGAASNLASFGFLCFLTGRVIGSWLLKKNPAHVILGIFGVANVIVCLLVFSKLGWISVACVFLSYFFMSVMFPTIFALGIFGLGIRAKKASSFIVMAIMGGAIIPKLMGYIADQTDNSRGFIIPVVCFTVVACYGFLWPLFSKSKGMQLSKPMAGH